MMKIQVGGIVTILVFIVGCAGLSNKSDFDGSEYLVGTSPSYPVLFVADPQIHNIYGVGLKQMLPIADWVSRVAIRPPEMNVLAPISLAYILETGRVLLPDQEAMTIVLGDGTNIGCSNELDLFESVMNGTLQGKSDKPLWLMAHGNHDSYMMGTVNSYKPTDSAAGASLETMQDDVWPSDTTWYQPLDLPTNVSNAVFGKNWGDACYALGEHGKGSTPMNKVRWLSRYLLHLQDHGLVPIEGSSTESPVVIEAATSRGSRLANAKFQLKGSWYRPIAGKTISETDFLPVWKSFIVQAADISPVHSVLLIDTSVCEGAFGGIALPGTNAGTRACIGEEQFEIIKDLMKNLIKRERQIIIAGHFPLHDLQDDERTKLIDIMSYEATKPWSYISGHTHNSISIKAYEDRIGYDVNIGSTTDWPLEGHLLKFSNDSSLVSSVETIRSSRYLSKSFKFKTGVFTFDGSRSELCRHLSVAEKLANLKDSELSDSWTRPPRADCSFESQGVEKWKEAFMRLSNAQQVIITRARKESKYREYVLKVAAKAARDEGRLGRLTIP